MKTHITLKRFLLAMLAPLFVLVSCDEPDDVKPEVKSSVRIKNLEWWRNFSGNSILFKSFACTYDQEGKMGKVVVGGHHGGFPITCKWTDDKLISTIVYENGGFLDIQETMSLDKSGRVIKLESNDDYPATTFSYNSDGRLLSHGNGYDETVFNYTWANNRIEKIHADGGSGSNFRNGDFTLEYTGNKTCKGFLPPILYHNFNYEFSPIFMVAPELIGVNHNALISEIKTSDSDNYPALGTIIYELNDEGYVTKITVGDTNDKESDYMVFNITWEKVE